MFRETGDTINNRGKITFPALFRVPFPDPDTPPITPPPNATFRYIAGVLNENVLRMMSYQ